MPTSPMCLAAMMILVKADAVVGARSTGEDGLQDTITTLQQNLDELNNHISALEKSLSEKPSYGLGEGDPRVARWELNRALLERLKKCAENTEGALSRARHGIYGVCERCGGAIDPERLAALPSARLCIQCALQDERDGSLRGQRGIF